MAETSAISWTRPRFGPAPKSPRDGDKKQARQRINVLVRTGRLEHPNTLPCKDCGHIWKRGERRHEYDHHKGYDAAHHYDVESVCTTCHSKRAFDRGEMDSVRLRAAAAARKASRQSHCEKGHPMSYGKDGMWRCQLCRREWFKIYRRERRSKGLEKHG